MKLRHTTTVMVFSAAMMLTPAALSAQFTTFVAPPRKATVDSVKPTPTVAKAKADSVSRMSLSDMKAWVDSAAGTSTQVATANDTTMAEVNAAAAVPTQPATPARTTTSFSNGAIAPNTATSLPTYLVAGLVSFAAGLLLLKRPRRA